MLYARCPNASAALKQRGAKYYENYMRKRKLRGGEFLGPPVGPALLQQFQQQQQQQQDPSLQQQQQQQQSAAQLSALSPAGFRSLLDQCLLATAPGPVSIADLPAFAGALSTQQQSEDTTEQPTAAGAVPQQRQQLSRQPWQFPDHVPADLSRQLLPAVKRKRGVTIHAPELSISEPLMPLPQLPARHSRHLQAATPVAASSSSSSSRSATAEDSSTSRRSSSISSAPAAGRDSSSSGSSGGGRVRMVHVFWDISSCHPAGDDPRVAVAQLKRVLRSYGQLSGIYAYAVPKMFRWVPEAFMLQYAPHRLPGRRAVARKQQARQQQQAQQREQQLQQQLAVLQASGIDLAEAVGPLRCPACGKLRTTYEQLHLHMVQRHKQPAPPLFRLLPEGTLQALSNAAGAGAAGSPGGLQQYGAASNSSSSRGVLAAVEAPVSSSSSSGNSSSSSSSSSNRLRGAWGAFDAASLQNSSTRTLGRVNRYFSSQGALFAPPDGHQISLKYVLLREGVDVRLVQNQARAVDVSLAHGVTQLLQRLQQRDAESAQRYEDVMVVISDQMTHAAALDRCRRAGMGVVAVCRKVRQYKGADVTLRWQWVVSGRYDSPLASAGAA
ncbi:hypothetical protein COO60DRAFT_328261 [Scenedesmus sp. NREL 46B-D3]|nr:hypothetical protein COO60DRAFT_328261 [Scenedesmus sp. NREL 46B-D3]